MEKLEEIKKSALERHIPIIMDDSLEIIYSILQEKKPKKLLEIGSAIGYSAICFEKYVQERIDTIELDEDRANEAENNIKDMGLCNKINLIRGNALDILPNLEPGYDIVFIDAAKSKYPLFLQFALNLSNKNSVIIADNVLYKGYVMSDYNKHKQRTAVRNLREFIKTITESPDLKSKILDVGDGMAIIEKQ